MGGRGQAELINCLGMLNERKRFIDKPIRARVSQLFSDGTA